MLELDGLAAMPSAVLADTSGQLIVGTTALSRAMLSPDSVEMTPKRRIGDPVLLLGGNAYSPVDAIAAIIGHVESVATAHMEGRRPERLVLTHPARWGTKRLDLMAEAARRCGLADPILVAEPVAASALLAEELAAVDDVLAVYDLGGGTLDLALVKRTDNGFVISGPPGGDENLGGEHLDDRIMRELTERLDPSVRQHLDSADSPEWHRARLQFRADTRIAKEALSSSTVFQWFAGPPVGVDIHLTSPELEELVRPSIESTVSLLLDTVSRAGLTPATLRTVVMVGGGSRMPIVTRLLAEGLGRLPTTWGDPKAAVCVGALVVADQLVQPAPAPLPAPAPAPAPPPDSVPMPNPVPEPVSDPVLDPVPVLVHQPVQDPPPAPPGETPPSVPSGPSATGGSPGIQPPDNLTGSGKAKDEWTAARIGVVVSVALVLLGVVSALLALVAR